MINKIMGSGFTYSGMDYVNSAIYSQYSGINLSNQSNPAQYRSLREPFVHVSSLISVVASPVGKNLDLQA